jgi:CII-binding regulator of phage lambda lysogenization HflD
MAKIATDMYGGATITLADGLEVRVPALNAAPNVTAQDIRNVPTALFALIERLDNRLAAIEKSGT